MNELQQDFQAFHRPVWAEIDLDHVAHNLHEFRRMLPSHVQLMAVVKADAYGHGAVEVAQAALPAGAARLAVAMLEEGILLRRSGLTAPIHILGGSAPGTEQAVVEHHLIPTIFTLESARRFAEVGRALSHPIPYHLKLDTGMGRIGARPEELPALLEGLRDLPALDLEGVLTHFARADERDKTPTMRQLQTYMHCLHQIQAAGFTPRMRCLANSAAAMELPDTAFDMVRIGISLYGFYPSDEVDPTRVNLRPVLRWKTRIAHLKTLPVGEPVSYGGRFVTPRPTVVATLPLGYADGFRRRLGQTGWHVLVRGHRAPLIGRVCMDMCLADVTDVPDVDVGDEVVVIGTQGTLSITADEMARNLDTIHYEITCLIGKRVPRLYFKNSTLIAIHSLLGDAQR